MNDWNPGDTKTLSRDALQAGGATSPEELVTRLRNALARDGDFPASAKVVSELRQLCNDPKTTANQITEVILREPSLGTRVLHLVNSSFYRRAKPIMTVSQAVIQIGMRPLAEMCAGLVLLQKFVPTARQGGIFANCLRKTVVTSLLASAVSSSTPAAVPAGPAIRTGKNDEFGYLAGSFAELGTLLLAFYFPQLYEAAVRRADLKRVTVAQSIKDLTGLSPLQLSLEVIDALNLPTFYKEVLSGAEALKDKSKPGATVAPAVANISKAVSAASSISQALVSGKTRQELDAVLAEVRATTGLEPKILGKVVGDLPVIFKDHCISLDLQLPALPEFVTAYSAEGDSSTAGATAAPGSDDEQQFNQFVTEIRQAVETREPTSSVITSVMETLVFGLKFQRAVLLLMTPNKSKLMGRLALGETDSVDPKTIVRPLGAEAGASAPDARAVKESRPVFLGDALLEGGWPFMALPIGFGQRCVGIIYADRLSPAGSAPKELNAREQAAVGILAELLDRSIALHA